MDTFPICAFARLATIFTTTLGEYSQLRLEDILEAKGSIWDSASLHNPTLVAALNKLLNL